MKEKVLVTGGMGYIGSHTIVDLLASGYEVISLDNLSNSTLANLDGIEKVTGVRVENVQVDMCDGDALEAFFSQHRDIKSVIHFAAYKYVGESAREPMKYFDNNLKSLIHLVECMNRHGIQNLIFSSSCTVYGQPDQLPVGENAPMKPALSPYGSTKQMGEEIIQSLMKVGRPLRVGMLRYFNPAGQHSSGWIRETTTKRQETLVPIIQEVVGGQREELVVFGGDYDTRDGSAVRDYLHVEDLASAHVLCLDYIKQLSTSSLEVFNLGLGTGVTVLEMIDAAEKVIDAKISHRIGPRRAGDVAATFADPSKAKRLLGWSPKKSIEDIFKSVFQLH